MDENSLLSVVNGDRKSLWLSGGEDGYIYYPNVNNTEEQLDLMEATRVYEANVAALSVVKAMASKALEIGKG